MKTQRRRNRLDRLTTSDSGPTSDVTNGVDDVGVTDGADGTDGATDLDVADGVVSSSSVEVSDGVPSAVTLEGNGSSEQLSNGSAQSSDDGHTDNGKPARAGSGTTVMLPKRKRRPETTIIAESKPSNGAKTATAVAQPERVAVAPVVTPAPAPTPQPAAGPWRLWLTYENLFWLALFALTIVTRFWDLGNRGIHHDESLHAVFSHTLYKGGGYIHDPMMHGPLQFHFIALMYWLFGATDATARFASVFCGVFVVMSPFFLRRQMGRLPAMVCAFLLFISPSILYFSRMAREDAIFSGMEMIMLVGLWRFISMRRPADFYLFCAGLALMFTIKESAYLTVLVLAIFFGLLFAYQAGYAIMGALAGYVASMGVLYLIVHGGMKDGTIPQLPNIPDQGPRYEQIMAFAGAIFRHPLVAGALAITLVFGAIVVGLFLLRRRTLEEAGASAPSEYAASSALPSRRVSARTADAPPADVAGDGAGSSRADVAMETASGADRVSEGEASEVWNPRRLDPKPGTLLARYEPGSLPHLVGSLFSRPSVLLIGFLIAATIFITLFTVFFTDTPRGIFSGLFASVGYWMAQQGVERGGQPWYYYMLLIPIYEPIAVFFSLAATIFFSWRGVRWVVRRFSRGDTDSARAPRLGLYNTDRPIPFASFDAFLPLFLMWWLFGVFAIYSWAGEKMPWLMVHMVRPAIFLASLFVGALIASVIARRRARIEEARLLDEDDYVEERGIVGRPVGARGALFSLSGVNEMAQRAGLAPRKLAAESGPASSYAFSMRTGGGRRPGAIPPPPRRGAPARVAPATTYVRVQDPPWVTWSRPESFFPFASFISAFAVLVLAWGLKMNAMIYFSRYDAVPATFPVMLLIAAVVTLFVYAWVRHFAIPRYSPDSERARILLVSLRVWTALLVVTFLFVLGVQGYTGWGTTWFFPSLILVLTAFYVAWVGPGRALRYLALGILAMGLMYQFRSAIMLTYNQPDVPKEMAVYVQTSPDVTRSIRELETYANYAAGNKKQFRVVYDSFTSWPMEWYLRDYNKRFIGGDKARPEQDEVVLFVEYAKHNTNVLTEEVRGYQTQIAELQNQPASPDRDNQIRNLQTQMATAQNVLTEYVQQRYAMRWWFPEEWYKNDFLPGLNPKTSPFNEQIGGVFKSAWVTISEPQFTGTLWKYLVFRDPPKPLGSEDMIVLMRRDIAQNWHYLQYPPPPMTDVPVRYTPLK